MPAFTLAADSAAVPARVPDAQVGASAMPTLYPWFLGGGFLCRLVHFAFLAAFCIAANDTGPLGAAAAD